MSKQAGFIETAVIGGIVFLMAVATFIYLFLVQPFRMSGSSMMPNLVNSEYFLAQKFDHDNQAGDIVLFKNPQDEKQTFVKRVIAIPGDKIKIASGEVLLNGKILAEKYIKEPLKTKGSDFLPDEEEKEVPAGSYFLMGDNREYSVDSRKYGFINQDKIIAKYWFSYYK